MAGKCNIIRDDKGNIQYTEAPNGQRSDLYDSLADKLGDKVEALKVWLTTKTEFFKESVINPIVSKYKISLANNIKANIVDYYKPTLVRTKNMKTIFVNRTMSDGFLPSVRYKGEEPTQGIQDTLSDFTNSDKVTTQSQIIAAIKSDIELLEGRKEVERKIEAFEKLIIPVLGKSVTQKDLNALEEQALMLGDWGTDSVEDLKKAMENAKKGLDPEGNPSDLALQPSQYDWSKGINYANFERFVNENPAYKGVFDDWVRMQEKSTELTLTDTKGFRSYKVKPLQKALEYLESGDNIEIIDLNKDTREASGRIRFKEKGPNTITVDSSLVKEGQLRRGVGTQLYLRLFQYATKRGMSVESNDKLTAGSEGVWKKLVSMGLAQKEGDIYTFKYNPPVMDTNGEVPIGAILNFVERVSRGEYVPTGMNAEQAYTEFDYYGGRLKAMSAEDKEKLKQISDKLLRDLQNMESPYYRIFQNYLNEQDLIPVSYDENGWNIEYKVEYKTFPKKSSGVDYTPTRRFTKEEGLGYTGMKAYDSNIVNSNLDIVDDRYKLLDDFELAQNTEVDPNYVYRGISEEELKFIKENGYIKSNASMNIGPSQANTTSFAQTPNQAFNYASWFSAWYDQPTFNTRKYVVKVSRKGIELADTENNKTSKGELDVANEVDSKFITEVFEVRLARTGAQSIEFLKTLKGNLQEGSRSPGGKEYAVRSLDKPNIKTFEKEMVAELKDMMLGLPVTSSLDLQDRLIRGFYSDGYFNPTRPSLEASGLYKSEEITELLTDEQALRNVKDFMYDLEKVDTEVLNDMYADENYLVVQDGFKNRMGTFILANPYLIEQKALDALAGIKDRDAFEDALYENESLEMLREPYWDNVGTKNDIFYKFKSYTRVAEIEVDEGQMSAKTSNTRTYLDQVLQEPKNDLLESNIEYLLRLDGDVIVENRPAVDKVIKLIQKGMIEIGLDVTNLDNILQEKSIGEFKSFIGAVAEFISTESPQSFDRLVGEYDTFFNVDDSFKYKAVEVSESIKQKNSFYLKTSENNTKLFKELGLLPIGKNTYKRLAKNMDLDALYEKVYAKTIENGFNSILPDEAFSPSGFDEDGTINLSKVRDSQNKEAILSDIRAFVQAQVAEVYSTTDNVTPQDVELYILAFNFINKSNNLNKFNEIPSMKQESGIFGQEISNQDYLRTDFIADFNVKMLKSKALNDLEYQEFFSNFEISSMGIELKSNDPITLSKIDKYLDDNQDLVDYLRLKKQGIDLIPSESQVFEDELFLRNYYSNYPTALKAFKGNVTKLYANTLLADTKDTFIRTREGLFELNQAIGGKGVYTRLEVNDSEFKVYNQDMSPAELDIDISEISAIETNFDTDAEVNNTYTQEEKDQIDNEEDNC
jgi:hypothetical protein